MFFRLVYILGSFDLGENNQLNFSVNRNGELTRVKVAPFSEVEVYKGGGWKSSDMVCIGQTERVLTIKRQKLFETMTKLPPEGLRQFTDDVRNCLYDDMMECLYDFRWWRGMSDARHLIQKSSGLEWSWNSIDWNSLPGEFSVGLIAGFPYNIKVTSNDLAGLQDLINKNVKPPLGHDLFCEAWHLRVDNSKSSLVIGIAAAESGFKDCVAILLPNAIGLSKIPNRPL